MQESESLEIFLNTVMSTTLKWFDMRTKISVDWIVVYNVC